VRARCGPQRCPLALPPHRCPQALGLGAGSVLAASGMLAGSGFSFEGPGSVAEALAVLAGIIFVHECGHFGMARWRGVHVSKFCVGFGPRLFSYQGPEVEYSFGLVPLGGFVAFPDDDPECPWPKDDPDLLRNRPLGDRAAVVVAGVLANVAFALVLLTTQALTVGQLEQTYLPGVRVPVLLASSAARDAGMKEGDIILAVNGEEVAPSALSVSRFVERIRLSTNTPLTFTLQRQGEAKPLALTVTPARGSNSRDGRIGVQLEANTVVSHRVASDLPTALRWAGSDFARLTGVVTHGLSEIVLNFSNTVDQISGPVAIVAVGAQVARGDPAGVFQFASIININLAVVNMLPLPALDGGFLALLAVEGLRGGKKLPVEVEQNISASGLLLLVAMGVTLFVRDTLHLVQ